MSQLEYFSLEEAVSRPGKYLLRFNAELFTEISTTGSFSVLPARLLNISYAQYLRFCRDVLSGELSGKGHLYPTPYFPKNTTTEGFVKLLNSRLNLVVWEREHPDWKEHQAILAEKKKVLENS